MKCDELLALADRVEAGEVKALSIKQPYPHHIFYDGKDVENRDRPTKGRGWVIVHAGVSKTELDMDDPKEAAMPRGGVVGMMRITDCVEQMDSHWFFGRYGFVIGEAFPLPLIPCKGALGFFALTDDARVATAAALRTVIRQHPGAPAGDTPAPVPAASAAAPVAAPSDGPESFLEKIARIERGDARVVPSFRPVKADPGGTLGGVGSGML